MPRASLHGRRLSAMSVAAASVSLLLVSGTMANAAPAGPTGTGTAAHTVGPLGAFLRAHPEFQHDRTQPLVVARDRTLQAAGDEGDETEELRGPAEDYANRAYPKASIAPAQTAAATRAFQAATQRGQVGSWQAIGPFTGTVAPEATYTGHSTVVSGRVTALAIAPGCSSSQCTVYVAAAGGGVWRTTNGLATTPAWTHIGGAIPSSAIGSLTLTHDGTLYVGTGEENGSSDSEAGVGLYRSTDHGASFTRISTIFRGIDFAVGRSVASVAIDPQHPNHLYVGTAIARHGLSSVAGGRFTPPGVARVGLYESRDGGSTWTRPLAEQSDTVDPTSPSGNDFFRGDVTSVKLDPRHASTVYATVSDYGLYRRVGTGSFKRIYSIAAPGSEALTAISRLEFSAVALPNGKTRIYLGDATLFPQTDSSGTVVNGIAGLLRTDDATAASPRWQVLSSSDPTNPGYGSYNFCEAQCWYDMVVASPPSEPDQVIVSGAMHYDELFTAHQPSNGRAVVRSTDAGQHWRDMTNDGVGDPQGLHPDHHALAFVPGTHGRTFITGSDGGVVRSSGPYVDISSQCDSRGLTATQLADCRMWLKAVPTTNRPLNDGLHTLQFQSVSVNPDNPMTSALGGTQDNGTWALEGSPQSWFESVGGDGGQSGFDAAQPTIRYHSYYAPQHDVNFNGSTPRGWDFISDPLLASGESAPFYTAFTVDPVNAGYVYDGLQHVWRTTDHGGPQAYLDQHCNELTGDFTVTCGDWQPLGGAAGDLSGGDPANYVVAVERAPSDTSTMWAATRKGGLFVSTNAKAADPAAVRFTRIDDAAGLPDRFVSGIWIDRHNPNHATVSFSGYSAYSPGGHVFDVTFNRQAGTATAKDLSYDLDDMPILDVVKNQSTGDLYAATDFGVLVLRRGTTSWVGTRGLPTVATYGLTLTPNNGALYAATHGRGIYRMSLFSS